MTQFQRHRRHGIAWLGVLLAHSALAGVVTVNVTTRSGAALEDTVIAQKLERFRSTQTKTVLREPDPRK